ncbi:MAG TPA: hypothetical protein VGB14_21190 [Acidimicrobiales bacterium]|jgi:hypothetical protein
MRFPTPLRVLLALVLAVALLGACGGDDDDGGEVAASSSTTAAADETTTSETTGSTEDTTEDTTDTSTDDSTDTSTDPTFTGDADSEWCGRYQELQDLPDPFGAEATSPEEAQATFDEAEGLVAGLVSSAPDEIAEATQIVATALSDLGDVLARYDWDFTRFSEEGTEEEFALFEDPALEDAGTQVEAYASQVCGIEDE